MEYTTTEGNEMEYKISAVEGSNGSLPGFKTICPECGAQMTSTMTSDLEIQIREHIAYHARKNAKAAR